MCLSLLVASYPFRFLRIWYHKPLQPFRRAVWGPPWLPSGLPSEHCSGEATGCSSDWWSTKQQPINITKYMQGSWDKLESGGEGKIARGMSYVHPNQEMPPSPAAAGAVSVPWWRRQTCEKPRSAPCPPAGRLCPPTYEERHSCLLLTPRSLRGKKSGMDLK